MPHPNSRLLSLDDIPRKIATALIRRRHLTDVRDFPIEYIDTFYSSILDDYQKFLSLCYLITVNSPSLHDYIVNMIARDDWGGCIYVIADYELVHTPSRSSLYYWLSTPKYIVQDNNGFIIRSYTPKVKI